MRRPLAMYYYLFLFVVANTSSVYILVHCIKFLGKIKVLLIKAKEKGKQRFLWFAQDYCLQALYCIASQSEIITEKYRLLFTSHFSV